MTRRWVGLIVIGAGLLLVAVIANLHPALRAGVGQAASVPRPPAIGDCVLSPIANPANGVPHQTTAHPAPSGPVYPVYPTAPCAAGHFGEITAIIATPRPRVEKGSADDRFTDDPNEDSCGLAAWHYVGIPEEALHTFWQPALQTNVAVAGPSTRQEATGQHWAACIVTLEPAEAIPRYSTSIRNALHTGTQSDHLSNCTDKAIGDDAITVGCQQRHAMEIFAYGGTGAELVSRSQVETTCKETVRQLTAMPDPTAGGALSIQIHVAKADGIAVTASQVPPHASLVCAVITAGKRTLNGSLLALGRQPVPWYP